MSHATLVDRTVQTANRLVDGTRTLVSGWAVRLGLQRATVCPRCARAVTFSPRYRRWRICPACGYHFPLTGLARAQSIADPHSFAPFDEPHESVIAGTALIAERPVVLFVSDFDYHGGTMSVEAGGIIARAFERAAERQQPVVGIIASGGVRIQQGLPALVQMARTTQAVQEFQRGHEPYIAILANPVTGGVYASFASLADIIIAEPGALLGFAGPRVAEAATGQRLPADSHHAESALANGMIDAIVPRDRLREALTSPHPLPRPSPLSRKAFSPGEGGGGWGEGGEAAKEEVHARRSASTMYAQS